VYFAYEATLLVAMALAGWCALDVLFDPLRRRRLACVGVLALSAFAWTAGTLLLLHARSPDSVLLARRILFAGVCVLPAAWVWCALAARRRPETDRMAGRAFLALLVPGLATYALLFTAPSGAFVDWYAQPIRRGPIFYAYAAWSWMLIAAGAALLFDASRGSRGGTRLQQWGAILGAALPVVANGVYVLLDVPPWPWDPTPAAFGISAVLFRVLVVDPTWSAQQPPVARAEVVAQMRDAVLVADRARRLVDWNEAAQQLFGSSAAIGRPLDELLHAAGRESRRALEIREFPLRRRGQVFGVGVVIADRTAQRESEIRLEMATRLEALGYLTAGVAHEINNPLSYVSANLRLLDALAEAIADPQAAAGLPASLRSLAREAPKLVDDAREGTERIQRVVETLASFQETRSASEMATRVDLRATVEHAAAMARFGKRDRPIEVRGAPQFARAVESDVIHVVFQLLMNAMQIGGDDVPITVAIETAGAEVAVHVADRGPGIAAHDLPHLFEPFYTTRRPSAHLGLGLSLCWELARRNGGRLQASNQASGGAVVTLWLPAAGSA
jgi:signal transduction histidine kinase